MAEGRRRIEGKRILVVEDDPDTSEVIRALLEQAGATVRTTVSAAAALRIFDQQGCDLVITDYALSGGATGYQLLQRIRAHPVDAHIPVIGYSAHTGLVSPAEQSSFTAYLPKPQVVEDIVETVRRVLERA